MKILLACPAPAGTRLGNRISAQRWARLLRDLGHDVRVGGPDVRGSADLLVALHARKSHEAVRLSRQRDPGRPIVVVLTGTDLYADLPRGDAQALQSLRWADRLVLLGEASLPAVPRGLRSKTRVILQSATPVPPPRRRPRTFTAIAIGHLRAEKDPFRAVAALHELPRLTAVRLDHLGAALDPAWEREARAWMDREPRYRWLGDRPHAAVLARLARADLLLHPSRMEGGPNALIEAIVQGVPVLASRIPGNVGQLGPRYPGYFPVGDTAELARRLANAVEDSRFLNRLRQAIARRAPRFTPDRERAAWAGLIRECAKSR